ncbi:MAG: hypothetical protein ABF331_02020 [Hellea sp.]|jgi:hypothetical protein
MNKELLTVLAIRWSLVNYPSGTGNRQISYAGLLNTFDDSDFEAYAKETLNRGSFSLLKKKEPTKQDVDEILRLLKVKVSLINAWPEILAAFHLIQAAEAIGDDNIFYDSFIDSVDDMLLYRIEEIF